MFLPFRALRRRERGKQSTHISDEIPAMTDVVRPMLQEAADKYVADNAGWETQKCK